MPVIRQRAQFTNSPIGVSSFDTGADRVYEAVSNFANTVGTVALTEGKRVAEQRGIEEAQALTSEEVVTQSKDREAARGFQTISQQSFNRVLDRRFVDTISNDIQLESKRIAQKYQDPVSYERVFGDYLRDLSAGADERFQGVVSEVAKYEMADQKLTLTAAARTRARAQAVSDLTASTERFTEAAFDQANRGNDDAALAIIEERSRATQEAVDADLPVKRNAPEIIRNEMAVNAMSGLLSNMLPEVDDPLEQAAISAYIRSQGESQGDLIDPARKARLDKFMPYVNTNTASGIISSFSQTNANLNQIRAVQQERINAQIEVQGRQNIVDFGNNVEALSLTYSSFASNAVRNPNLLEARGNLQFIESNVRTNIGQIEQQYVSGQIESQSDYEGMVKEVRQAGLRSVVLAAATGGNIDSLKAYMTSGDPANLGMLTASQRNLASTLRQSALYTDEDRNYVEDLLSGSKNAVLSKAEQEMSNAMLSQSVSQLSQDFTAGIVDRQRAEAVMSEIQQALQRGDITSARFETLTETVSAAQAKGIVNFASDVASSSDMLALTNFIRTNGQEAGGLSPEMRTIGEQVLASTPESKRSEVTSHANSIRQNLDAQEQQVQRQIDAQAQRIKILSGGGSPTSAADRKTTQEIFDSIGLDVASPDSKSDEAYSIMRSAPPQALIDGLTSISLGIETPGAEVLLDHFAVLSNDATATGVMINRFGTGDGAALSGAKIAMLQDIISIRKITGLPANEIATTLIERRNDPKSDRYVESVFGKNVSPKEYVSKEYGPLIAEDLGDAAEYYARTGLSKEDIDNRLNALVETRFAKSDVVVDPRFPMGTNNRTMYSLEAQFPDEDRRNEFKRIIEAQLPDGFELARKESNRERTRRALEADIEPPKYVYLVPSESTSGAAYYSYFLDESDELRPLITEINGQMTWPLFDDSELKDFDIKRAAEREAKIEAMLDQAQRTLDVTSQRPGMRSLAETQNLTLR